MGLAGNFIVVLSCAAFLSCGPQNKSRRPEPGMDLYSVAPDSVREVLVSSSAVKIYAYRWTSNQPFELIVASRPKATADHCTSGKGFDALLQALATAPVIEELAKQFEDGSAWADVRLRDSTNLAPIEIRVRFPEAQGEPVAVLFQGHQYVVRMDTAGLKLSTMGCKGLSRP